MIVQLTTSLTAVELSAPSVYGCWLQRWIDLDQKHLLLPDWLQPRQHPSLPYLQPLVVDMAARRKERELYERGVFR